MKTNTAYQRVPTRFSDDTGFELTPLFEPRTRDLTQASLEQLKSRLLKPHLEAITDSLVRRQLRLVANEAAAIAWTTSYPLLVMPVLLQEKLAEVRQHTARQRQIEQASHVLMEAEA